MQEEKVNNHIRSSMEDLAQLPEGFVFDSQKTWHSLEHQLPRNRQRNTSWYYAAAVLLLAGGIAYFTLFNTSEKDTLVPASAVSVIPAEKNVQPVPGNDIAPLVTVSRKPKQVPPKNKILPVILSHTVEQKTDIPLLPTEVMGTLPAPPIATLPVTEIKKTPVVTAARPAVKKYAVIHINELTPATALAQEIKNHLGRWEPQKTQPPVEKEAPANTDNIKQLLFLKIKSSTTTITEN